MSDVTDLNYEQKIAEEVANARRDFEKTFVRHSPVYQMLTNKISEFFGEAANKIDDQFRDKYPAVPWYKIVGMRNLLIHEYLHVGLDQVWNTI